MRTQNTKINGIPAVLWGEPAPKLLIAVHGLMSNKSDTVIEAAARIAEKKGYRTVSIDLPQHGDRKDEPLRPVPWVCTEELLGVYGALAPAYESTSIFGCSLGAYMELMAFGDTAIRKTLLLSPVLDMRWSIEDTMERGGLTLDDLQRERYIEMPYGLALEWEYYLYACAHPATWDQPAAILWGRRDEQVPEWVVDRFAAANRVDVRKVDAEHYFHTEEDLVQLTDWLWDKLD